MTDETVTIPMAEYRCLAAIHVHAAEMANLLERQRDDDAVADVLSRYDSTAIALGRHVMARAMRG